MSVPATEIPKNWVDETWQEIGGLQDEMKAAKLSQSFSKKQPALAEFTLSLTEELSADANELSYYIGLVVWRCYESYFKRGLRRVTSNEVIKQYEKMEKWLEILENTNDRFIAKRISNKSDYEQKHIFQYIVQAIFESRGEDIQLTEEEEGTIFMVLKVHMDCLDLAVKDSSH